MPDNTFNQEAEAYLERFMEEMRSKEAFEMVTLSNGYGQVIKSLQSEIDALSQIDAKSINQIFREKRFNDFLEQAENLHGDYATDSASLISTIQGQFAKAGLETTQGLLTTLTRDFNLLPVDAINNIIGFTADGSPLDEVLLNRYGESYRDVANTLITSVAKGLNPRETARLIGESLQGNLYDTLRIARTEQMRAFRTASLVQMEQSGVVDGWEWVTEPNACEFCESMSGKVFALNVNMDTHPNCRCIQAPFIKTGDKELTPKSELNEALEEAGLEPQNKDLEKLKTQLEEADIISRHISENLAEAQVRNEIVGRQLSIHGRSRQRTKVRISQRALEHTLPSGTKTRDLLIVGSRFNSGFIKNILEIASKTPNAFITLDYFKAVKSLPDINAKYYLERAITEHWTLEQLKQAVKKTKKK